MDAPTILELRNDDGTVTLWTVPELTAADVAEVIRQHGEELVPCPDCDDASGYVWLPGLPTRPACAVKCATCDGAGQLARAELQAMDDQEDR